MWGFPHNGMMPRISATERVATRRRLIEAAKAEFAARGLAGARFDEISLSAGHAKGTIYNYFDSKERLFLTVVEDWCGLLADAAHSIQAASARDRVLEIAAIDVEIARKDPDLARVVVLHMPALVGSDREATWSAVEPGLNLLEVEFARGLKRGEFLSRQSAPALARLFFGNLSAFELEALQPEALISLDDVVELLDRHFMAGLDASSVLNQAAYEQEQT